jgi:hypothetical protein
MKEMLTSILNKSPKFKGEFTFNDDLSLIVVFIESIYKLRRKGTSVPDLKRANGN